MGASCSASGGYSSTSATPIASSSGNDGKHWQDLFGDKLESAGGAVSTAEALAGKTVGIYFSAHWCPPCRGFTPKLAQIFKALKGRDDFQIVFVSCDRDKAAFSSYFKEQPWLALPFEDKKRNSALSQKFGVSGIPYLVLIDANGEIITKDGRSKVLADPQGKTWLKTAKPSKPLPAAPAFASEPQGGQAGLEAVIGGAPLLGKSGAVELRDVMKDAPLVALYFSAHWCGPCRAFTPKLITFVEMLAEEGIELPVIFGSSDRDQASFASYYATMPWHAFPHTDKRIEALKKKYAVSGIPWLVVLDRQGNLVMNEADIDVPEGPQAYSKWLKKAKGAVAAAPAA